MRRSLFASLALLSVLAACKETSTATVSKVATTADSADQVMFKMRTILTDRGVQRAELQADTGYFFDENTRAELRIVTTTFFNKDGASDGVLTARRGTYNMRANVMEARENVVIIGADGRKLTSPMVRFEQFRNLIVSDSPFVLLEGERRLEGIGFESDPQMLSVKIKKLSRGTGASIMLPTGVRGEPAVRGEPPAEPAPVPPAPGASKVKP